MKISYYRYRRQTKICLTMRRVNSGLFYSNLQYVERTYFNTFSNFEINLISKNKKFCPHICMFISPYGNITTNNV